MTLGQEFSTYAVMLEEDEARLEEAALLIREINLGATAIGTGINAHPDYAALVCRHLADITGIPVDHRAQSHRGDSGLRLLRAVVRRAEAGRGQVVQGVQRSSAVVERARAGFGEINLPARQAGSSIMPGKVNPVIPEVVNQIAFEVIGNDLTVTLAAEAGQLQLNAFEPIIAHSLFKSITSTSGLPDSRRPLHRRHHRQSDRLEASVRNSIGIVTALNPYIGYANATDVAREAHRSGRGVAELVIERNLMSAETLAEILRPEVLTGAAASAGELQNRSRTIYANL